MSGSSLSTAAGELLDGESQAVFLGTAASPDRASDPGVAAFVRTPFEVRRNVVKVWRPLPPNLWTALASPCEVARSKRRERKAVVGVGLMALFLVAVAAGAGYRQAAVGGFVEFPLVGGMFAVGPGSASVTGWYFAPGQMLPAILWVVGPSLAGWAFVRGIWIPLSAAPESRAARLSLARNLSGTYFYVYLMIAGGALLMPLLIAVGAEQTATLRWCLWCFLFGESFFVPAVMWSRMVLSDAGGLVFGHRRYWLLTAYVLLFVIIPIIGMALENSRGAG